MRYLTSFCVVVMLVSPAVAETKYSTWKNPDDKGTPAEADNRALSKLIDELKALVDDAQRARAADPLFLRDLRDLARKYGNPWGHQVLVDDFGDGEYKSNPVWRVVSGKFLIERNWGLRSALSPQAQSTNTGQPERLSGRDAAKAILEALLKKKTNDQGPQKMQPVEPAVFSIYSVASIANAFSLTVDVSSWHAPSRNQGDVQFDFGPYQGTRPYRGTRQSSGYRLVYTSGGPLRLIRTSSRGISVVEATSKTIMLEDRKVHALTWTRDVNGTMKVGLDGETLFQATDRGFRDKFDGIVFNNRGGDFIVKRVAVFDNR